MKILCNKTTKKIEGFSRWDDIPHDTNTYVVLDAVEVPDMEKDLLNATNDGIDKAPLPTAEELATIEKNKYIKSVSNAVQSVLDSEAQAAGYDNIHTAVTYAAETAVARFSNEGKSFRKWRSLVWDYCYSALAQFEADMVQHATDMATYQDALALYEIEILADPPLDPVPVEPVMPIAPVPPLVDDIVASMPVRV